MFIRSRRAKAELHRILGSLIRERRRTPLEPADFLQDLIESRYPDGRLVPEDVIVNLVEVPRENWSFGGGVMSYPPSP